MALRKLALMHRFFGVLDGHTCRECSNFINGKYHDKVFCKCKVYGLTLGINGIQCGSEANGVQITPTGNLYAENGYFRGSVSAGRIDYGGDDGYLDGSGLASHSVYGSEIGYNTISTAYTSGGINTSLGYADFANGVFNGWNTASYVDASVLFASSFYFKDEEVAWRTIKDGNGLSQTVLVRA